jgi:Peroxisomal biogenesis factor 11 (PEX11)
MTERSSSPLPPLLRSSLAPTPLARPRPSHDALRILRDALLVTEGKDKVIKLMQYSSRLILLLSSAPSKRLRPFISQMSMTRKVIKLGHGIFPYMELSKGGLRTLAMIRAIVEFINDFWDDVYCLSRIGFLKSARLQHVSEEWANRSWMTGTLIDLWGLWGRRRAMKVKLDSSFERKFLDVSSEGEDRALERTKLLTEAYWIDVSILKLFMDLGFCGSTSPSFRADYRD